MKLYNTQQGCVIEHESRWYSLPNLSWDEVTTRENAASFLNVSLAKLPRFDPESLSEIVRAPMGAQEVWAAGVTYYRSRDARMEESQSAGGGDFYDRVYRAQRPELFFKATPHRVVGPGAKVAIRRDAKWSVPEPELALLVSPGGKILGYTVANDMSSRDIEGENPLYLPQAKVYDRSCALGPCVLVSSEPLPHSTGIHLDIVRGGKSVFAGSTTLNELKSDT